MDKGSYTMKSLYDSNDKFTAPGFHITIDGKKLDSSKYHIPTLEVEQRADGTAGGCTFTLEGQYDRESSSWSESLSSIVKAGAKLAVTGGYANQKDLFYGYVDEYTLEFPENSGTPRITVTGMDGLGFLMNQHKPVYGGKKKAAEVIKEILNQSVSAGFAKKVTVGTLKEFQAPLVKEGGDDWRFLNLLAARYGMTLFVLSGEMIFDNVAGQTSPILTLTLGTNLKSFEKRVSLARQVGKVEIRGRDVNQKPIKGEASSVSVGGSGKSAAQLVPALKQSVLREFSELVRTQAECTQLAQARLDSIAMGLVSGKGRCVGVPQLIPGRYITIEGGDAQTNGSYLLTKVRHIFEHEGYITEFEVKGAKI